MKKLKKLLATTLAMVMALALTVPAFAAVSQDDMLEESEETQYDVYLEGGFYAPTIRVQISGDGIVYVNPAKGMIAGKIEGFLDGTDDLEYKLNKTTPASVFSTPIVVRSDTAMEMTIQVTATAEASNEDIELVTGAGTAASATDEKQIALELYGNYDSGSNTGLTADSFDANGLDDSMLKLSGATFTQDEDNTHMSAAKSVNAGYLSAVEPGATIEPSYGVIGVKGTLSPLAADEGEWTADDTVSVTIALSFVITDVPSF